MQNKLKKISDKYTHKNHQISNGFQRHQRKEDKENYHPSMDRSKAIMEQTRMPDYDRKSYNFPQRGDQSLAREISFSRIPNVSHSVERIPQNHFRDSRMDHLSQTKQPEPLRIKDRRAQSKFQEEITVTRKDVKELISNHINRNKKEGEQAINEFKNRQTRQTLKLDSYKPKEDSQAVQKLSSLQDKIQASLRPYRDI